LVTAASETLDPTVVVGVLAAAEGAINRALKYAPKTQADLAALSDQSIRIVIHQPEFQLTCLLGYPIKLQSIAESKANASVEGSLSDYLTIVSSDDPALINGDLTIGGDSRLLQQLQRLLGELDIDWEAPIAAVTGDVVGHQIGRSLRGILAWGKTSRASIERQLKEFIIEEARLSPSEAELSDFYDDIRRLQQTIDRVDAKLKRLGRRRDPV
jgi:ubiquinone biosynthesis accessory factor UbiJ